MMEFMKKAMDWVIDKEQDAAKKCYIHPNDVDKQIDALEKKKASYQKEYDDNMSEIEHILNRLNTIKANSIKCDA